ncbi:potassium-dependent sodium-calcium exchanger-like protein 3 [Dinothrombium tinctorium]|uniref:Potassium-dependent sodium-calcium exchanger-like protein 3 n=1 Tax=Dinothrombium tinctorium TaxID=1965070 RepID=A0A443RR39_9ACAR|nr:potassium-dependent sodium-calcium exchanger-like protein 3 [Dinothrombium tinctorium]
MLIFYVIYIVVMHYNLKIKDIVTTKLKHYSQQSSEEFDALKSEPHSVYYQSFQGEDNYNVTHPPMLPPSQDPNRTSLYEAANIIIIKHKRLFPALSRFRASANLILVLNDKRRNYNRHRLQSSFARRHSVVSLCATQTYGRKNVPAVKDLEHWRRVPNPAVEGWFQVVKWCIDAPLHASLFYTIPNCKVKSNLFLLTFLTSIFWTGVFSYIMVWMVTLIGFTFGIPDSIMGITFLAAGTSVPDAYASIYVAKMGQADMAVSNSIGSNVFDILVGLALPWFIKTAIVSPGTTALINSRGLFFAIVLLFLSLLITIFLFHHSKWTLNPRLGKALILTYIIFLILCSALEFNLFVDVNLPTCTD